MSNFKNRLQNKLFKYKNNANNKLLKKDDKYFVELEELISKISNHFIGLNHKNFDIAIYEALKSIGKFIKADRCYIITYNNEKNTLNNIHEWHRTKITSQLESRQNLNPSDYPWILEQLNNNKTVYIPSVSQLSVKKSKIKNDLTKQEVKSLIAAPMFFAEKLTGYLGFDFVKAKNEKVYYSKNLLNVVSGILGNSLEHIKLESDLEKLEKRYELVINASNDGIWDYNLIDKKIFFSDRWKSMLGYSPEEVSNNIEEWFNKVHVDDIEIIKTKLEEHILNKEPFFECEYRIKHKNGSYKWMLCHGLAEFDSNNKALHIAGSQTDITARKLTEFKLQHEAFHDPLTNIPNRFLFMDRLKLALARTRRHPERIFAVLLLDLDRFKILNDSIGHNNGDKLLVKIASRLQVFLRSEDTLARLDGDTFAILLENIQNIIYATRLAKKIQKAINLPVIMNEKKLYPSASIGIVLSHQNYKQGDELLRDAEVAMYRAKKTGRAKYEIFYKDMHSELLKILNTESDLRRAIDNKEFTLYYQPIVSLENNKINGFEALIRWKHPIKGIIYPIDFISTAEETGLIIPIGEWVLKTSCKQISKWINKGYDNITVSVNFSVRQFENNNLLNSIQKIIKKTNIPPQSLKIEITETIAMKNYDFSIKLLNRLNTIGIRISIDDFGTGYSSFSYLKNFPIDYLKIDKSFIEDISKIENNHLIIKAIINMAHSLNLKVIAEGVENSHQLNFLKNYNCDLFQGYFFSHPISNKNATKLLKHNRI